MININQPFMPPQEEYEKYLSGVWKRAWLTNNGPLVNELELSLKDHLNLEHLLYVTNGTIALQIAIQALELRDEIITTPFSFIATTSSIVWEGCTPVFADIDSETLNIDPKSIRERITDKTTAILATHVYGIPCAIDEISAIAEEHNLKVIYDAAHCFGVTYQGRSVFEYGDISTTSFHATKLYHTVEGGAVFTRDPQLLRKMSFLRNFGHFGPYNFEGIGINGKNSEFHAAMGLCNLKYIDQIIEKRKALVDHYDEVLKPLGVSQPTILDREAHNFSYYPIIFDSEEKLLTVSKALSESEIFTRRYFYPSLANLDYVDSQHPTPVCDEFAKRVLCLPLYYDLTFEEIDMISRISQRAIKYEL